MQKGKPGKVPGDFSLKPGIREIRYVLIRETIFRDNLTDLITIRRETTVFLEIGIRN